MKSVLRFALLALSLVACSSDGGLSRTDLSPLDPALLAKTGVHGDSLPPKTVALTFDDGPDEHTIELATYLHDEGIRVTFFINGRRICKTEDPQGNCVAPMDTRPCDDGNAQAPVISPRYYRESILDDVIRLGHRVANHTEDHCHLKAQTMTDDLVFELATTQAIVDRHVCDGVFLFRPPYGDWDSATMTRARTAMSLDKLVGPILWDIDGEDWDCWQKDLTPDACGAKYMKALNARANRNGIVLMHDRPEFNVGYEGPVLLAKWFVSRLKADGYKFATLDEVLGRTPSDAIACAIDAGGGDAGDDAGGGSGSSGGAAGSSGSAGAGGGTAGSGGTSSSADGGSMGSGGIAPASGGTSGEGGARAGAGGDHAGAAGVSAGSEGGCTCAVMGRESRVPRVSWLIPSMFAFAGWRRFRRGRRRDGRRS